MTIQEIVDWFAALSPDEQARTIMPWRSDMTSERTADWTAEPWRHHTDNYSEHYEVTNTDRQRAEYGDGFLFKMGDKDSAGALRQLLNQQDAEIARLRDQVQWLREGLQRIAAVEIADSPQPLYAAAGAHAECIYIARALLDEPKEETND